MNRTVLVIGSLFAAALVVVQFAVVDDGGKTAIAYGIGGVPETFFLDASGTIVAKYAGPLTEDELQANLAKAMKR